MRYLIGHKLSMVFDQMAIQLFVVLVNRRTGLVPVLYRFSTGKFERRIGVRVDKNGTYKISCYAGITAPTSQTKGTLFQKTMSVSTSWLHCSRKPVRKSESPSFLRRHVTSNL